MAGNEELSQRAQSPWEGERPVVSEKIRSRMHNFLSGCQNSSQLALCCLQLLVSVEDRHGLESASQPRASILICPP